MKTIRGFAVFAAVGLATIAQLASGAAFSPGNLAIYRVGDGVGTLANTGGKVFIDEYTTGGTLVQSIELPSEAGLNLVASGTATSEGFLNLSADGSKLVLTGYNSTVPAASSLPGSTSATVNRVVGVIDAAGSASLYGFNDYVSAGSPRSAALNGSNVYLTGANGGVKYADLSTLTAGSTDNTTTAISTTVTNLRALEIFGGQLYVSTGSGSTTRIGAVGAGLPVTTGESIVPLAGLPIFQSNGTTSTSPYGFFLADLNSSIEGYDTLYVADDSTGASATPVVGVGKYSLVDGSWVSNGYVGAAGEGYRGLTASVSGSSVTLFATRRGGSTGAGGGELVSIVDATGYNGAFSAEPTLLATAATNTAFRGIDFVPSSGGGGEFAAADFNENGAVDGTDLGIWSSGYGLTGAPKSSGDATGEGDVDGRDFLVWQRQYTGTPVAAAAVPEPASVGLSLVVLGGLALAARRGRRS
ncbi:MAG: hypothetical protein KF847_01870 [Pirellulales bacterium]|nr:hypothetical protein [Pirellulales bacterium]